MAFAASAAAIVTAVAAVGTAYSQIKSGQAQQRMANVQNARERKQALREMRMRQRALEAQGVASGTFGSSSMEGAVGAARSSTAGAIGYQGALLANAQSASHWNNMATGFGALGSVTTTLAENQQSLKKLFGKD